jgi:hypothetical protein
MIAMTTNNSIKVNPRGCCRSLRMFIGGDPALFIGFPIPDVNAPRGVGGEGLAS